MVKVQSETTKPFLQAAKRASIQIVQSLGTNYRTNGTVIVITDPVCSCSCSDIGAYILTDHYRGHNRLKFL